MPKTTPEDTVRAYLTYLADPSSLVDPTAVAKAQAKVDKAKDPIVRVRAMSDLARAEHPDPSGLVDAFVACAADWVATEGLEPAALTRAGVPADVLSRAGLASSNGHGPRPKKTAKLTRKRAPSLTFDELVESLPGGPFTSLDFAAAIGRTYQTTRNYITQLIEQGVIEDLGQATDWAGKGKAPHRYQRV